MATRVVGEMLMRARKRGKTEPTSSHHRRGQHRPSMCLPAYAERGYSPDRSNRDPLDFIERDLIAGAVVELGRARALVRRHDLGVFERAADLEIRGDAGCTEYVAAELDPETGFGRAPADHAIGVDTVHRLIG